MSDGEAIAGQIAEITRLCDLLRELDARVEARAQEIISEQRKHSGRCKAGKKPSHGGGEKHR